MGWLKSNLLNIMALMKIGKDSVASKMKPLRPKIISIFTVEVVNNESMIIEEYIVINSKGETLAAPKFSDPVEATSWLENEYPAKDYTLW
ncbi:hypothetical protein [Burkholderia cepacia]|uniref:hypothetical protein n=1 Tax=Burkholderia cepacia TaxID=292 RepID=UPI000AEB744E|nr:hypothetical protein [Burkholderia cepacia]